MTAGAASNPPTELTLCGIGVSPGLAHGPVHLATSVFEAPETGTIDAAAVPAELDRLRAALEATRAQIKAMQDRIDAEVGTEGADILDVHLMMLEDRSLLEEVESRIRNGPQNAEEAFYGVMSAYIETLKRIGDAFLSERAVDIEDVARRVVRNLRGTDPVHPPSQPHILIAPELTPSETAAINREAVLGFATESGSHTSHSAILARSMGVPAVVGLPELTSRLHTGQEVLLDGYRGLLIVNPTEETLAGYDATRRRKAALDRLLREMVDLPAETPDGQRVILAANIEFEHEMKTVREWGAQGVGLYRTEFFYLNRDGLPTEDEQAENYTRVAAAAGPEGVIIRTLDIGGDKLHGFHHDGGAESNPFLGWRGIRVSLARPHILRTQLRAILRASAHGRVRIMFPMISCLHEMRSARAVLEDCKAELTAQGVPWDRNIEVGAMIEVPSAALTADILAAEADFFSIGTNDLIQYTIAVDRGNDRVAGLYQPTHPAILRLLQQVVDAARSRGIRTGVCGEMAADIQLTPLMIGLGFEELSMAAGQIPLVKYAVRRLPAARCRALVGKVLRLHDPEQIYEASRDLALEFYGELLI